MSRFRNNPSPVRTSYVLSLIGDPGVGKTTFFVEAGALILDFERGFLTMECDAICLVDKAAPPLDWTEEELVLSQSWGTLSAWERFKIVVYHVGRPENLSKYGRFSMFCIDTIDACYEACVDFVCKQNGWRTPDDAGKFGKGWNAVLAEFRTPIEFLLSHRSKDGLGVGIGFVSHSKVRTTRVFGEEPRDKLTAALAPSAAKWLFGISDFVFFAECAKTIDGLDTRVLHTQPSSRFDAKSRGRRDRPFPSPISLDFDAFAAAWESVVNPECAPAPAVELQPRVHLEPTGSVWVRK